MKSWDYFFWVVWAFVLVIVLVFGLVVLIGAPYMPTLRQSCKKALKLLDLQPGQTLIDLGCGDGIMLKMAADSGLKAIGYEINPFLVVIAKLRTIRYGRKVKVKWGNFWRADLSKADGIFVFLLDRYMSKLDNKISAEKGKGVKLVSHAFKIPGKAISKKSGALFLYEY